MGSQFGILWSLKGVLGYLNVSMNILDQSICRMKEVNELALLSKKREYLVGIFT